MIINLIYRPLLVKYILLIFLIFEVVLKSIKELLYNKTNLLIIKVIIL